MQSLQCILLKSVMRKAADKEVDISVKEFRDNFYRRSLRIGKVAKGTRIKTEKLGGCSGELLVATNSKGGPVILHFHGGGYVFASAHTHRGFVSQILARSGGAAFVLDYRRAPENPYPAALDDAVLAYKSLLARSIPPEKIAFAGESAGAGLALATMLRAREESLPMPSCAALVSPWVDLSHSGASITENAGRDVLLRKEQLMSWAEMYAANMDRRDPLLSPLYGDHTGFPPVWISIERDELLFSETCLLADRMKKFGVEVQLEVGEGLMHVWPFFYSVLPEGRKTIRRMADFIKSKAGVLKLD